MCCFNRNQKSCYIFFCGFILPTIAVGMRVEKTSKCLKKFHLKFSRPLLTAAELCSFSCADVYHDGVVWARKAPLCSREPLTSRGK